MRKKINIFLVFIINFIYINNGLITKFGLGNFDVIISIFTIMLNMIYLLKNGVKIKFKVIYIYIFILVLLTIISVNRTGLIESIIGLISLLVNMLLWVLILNNDDNTIIKCFFKMNVIFAAISSILGIYQYFIDSTIFGLATHSLYASNEVMNSGKVLRRITSLMGSPQNFSLYIAICTGFTMQVVNNKTLKYLIIILLSIAGMLSGSRAYSLTIMITVIFFMGLKMFHYRKIKRSTFLNIIFIAPLVTILILGVFLKSNIINNNTVSRIFNFFSDWPALQVFISNFKNLSGLDYFLGKGIGYNERLVSVLLGTEYKSVESFLLGILMQGGLILLGVFLLIYLNSIIKSFKFKNYFQVSILISLLVNMMVTPSFGGLTMSFIIWPIIIYPYTLEIDKGIDNIPITKRQKE